MMKIVVGAGLMVVASSAMSADDFDITMDVVSQDESFNDAIVNRIALPFERRDSVGSGQVMKVKDDNLLEELEEATRDALQGSASGGDSAAGTPNTGLDGFSDRVIESVTPK